MNEFVELYLKADEEVRKAIELLLVDSQTIKSPEKTESQRVIRKIDTVTV